MKPTDPFPEGVRPELLRPVERDLGRRAIGIVGEPPFTGVDIWNAFELSWLDAGGRPRVAIGTFIFPASSPRIVESKSLKLYLHSLNQTRFESIDTVRETIVRHLGEISGARVAVELVTPDGFAALPIGELEGESLDGLEPRGDLEITAEVVSETLVTNLLKTNCPMTGQPDWASLQVRYRGPRIGREAVLKYVISLREHRAFHEECVERIFMELLTRCAPERLTVYARYTRRGGIDINPFRTNCGAEPGNRRTWRQ